MGKFLTYMLAVIVIFLGLSNIAFCVSWIFDRSGVIGNPNQLEKEFAENSQGYTITYNLDDGTLEKDNPKEYGLFTATFTLNNPTKDGYKFLGWTGSNGETPQTKITICTGSCGDLEFNANFALILGTPEVTLEQNIVSWNSVDNATGYVVSVNGTPIDVKDALTYNLRDSKQYLIAGANLIKVKAYAGSESESYVDGMYSTAVYYVTTQLDAPSVRLNEFMLSWNEVESANGYFVAIGSYTFTIQETSINLLNYLDFLSTSGTTTITVKALAVEDSDVIDSLTSTPINFTKPKFEKINLTFSNGTFSWNYSDKVETYEVYVNNVLCLTLTGQSSISSNDINSYCVDGTNKVCVTAKAKGYDSATSNTYSYVYYDVQNLENLTFKVYFNRYSSNYSIYTGYASAKYSFTGELLSGLTNDNLEEVGLTFEEYFIQKLNIGQMDISNLYLSNITLYELVEFIDASYVQGETNLLLNVKDKFYFILNDSNKTIYTPEKVYLEVEYETMYSETLFYEGCSVDISECTTYNIVDVGLYAFADGDAWIHTAFNFVDIDGNKHKAYFREYFIREYITFGFNDKTYESLLFFDPIFDDVKFYLNSEYYFMLKDKIGTDMTMSGLLMSIHADAKTKRAEYEESINYTPSGDYNPWSYNIVDYTFDLKDYIDVYSNDGTKVTFDYSIYTTYTTIRTI